MAVAVLHAHKAMKAPFPYCGGKSGAVDLIWPRLGDVRNYIEPFFGSGPVLLNRPRPFAGVETVNDINGFVANFWRAVRNPAKVAAYADCPVNENDLHARHAWLQRRKTSLRALLEGNPDYYNSRIAGWWCWGMCCWIGHGFCFLQGPWRLRETNGVLRLVQGNAGQGVQRKLVHLGNAGQGVQRKLVHLGDAGQGVQRKLVHESNGNQAGQGLMGIQAWMQALSDRLARVRVACGDWGRICTNTVTVKQGLTGVFFDPPYATAGCCTDLYEENNAETAVRVRQWCLDNGHHEKLRICLAGYAGQGHEVLEDRGWSVVPWKARGGYANQGAKIGTNAARERLWFSPHCLSIY